MPINDTYESRAQIVREFLAISGFRRDNRCKKWETYKKTVDGRIHRVKFNRSNITFDWFDSSRGVRGSWRMIRSEYYIHIASVLDLQFISPIEVSDDMMEEIDNNDYLERMGVTA